MDLYHDGHEGDVQEHFDETWNENSYLSMAANLSQTTHKMSKGLKKKSQQGLKSAKQLSRRVKQQTGREWRDEPGIILQG